MKNIKLLSSLVALTLLVAIVLALWPKNQVTYLSMKNTGQNPVWVRTIPPLVSSRLSIKPLSWPPIHFVRTTGGDAYILSGETSISNGVARDARIEVCFEIPTNHPFYPHGPSQIFVTSSTATHNEMSNLQFRTVWHDRARVLVAEVNGNNPTNPVFRVLKIDK